MISTEKKNHNKDENYNEMMWKYEEWRWDVLGSRSCDNQVKWKAEMVTDDTVSNTPPFSAFLLDSLTLFDILWHSLTFVKFCWALWRPSFTISRGSSSVLTCIQLPIVGIRRDPAGSCGILDVRCYHFIRFFDWAASSHDFDDLIRCDVLDPLWNSFRFQNPSN